jgi:anti-sigma factor RsiW
MTHVHEDLGAYVLGGLDEAEAARVKAHVAE